MRAQVLHLSATTLCAHTTWVNEGVTTLFFRSGDRPPVHEPYSRVTRCLVRARSFEMLVYLIGPISARRCRLRLTLRFRTLWLWLCPPSIDYPYQTNHDHLCTTMSKGKFEKAVKIVQSLPKDGPIQPTQDDQLYVRCFLYVHRPAMAKLHQPVLFILQAR